MQGEQKEIARFKEGLCSITLFQDDRRLDAEDTWVRFHAELTYPGGQLILGEGSLSSVPYLCYKVKQKIDSQREKFEDEVFVPA